MRIVNPQNFKGDPLISNVNTGDYLEGNGTVENPLDFKGMTVKGNNNEILSSKIKSIKSGDNISFEISDNELKINSNNAESECTSFYVYANAEAIAVGTNHPVLGLIQASPYDNGNSIPAQMTHKMAIRSMVNFLNSDVVVDWGDGSKTVLADDCSWPIEVIDWNKDWSIGGMNWFQTASDGETVAVLIHTYENEGKYLVKVFGNDYFGIANHLSVANQNASYANDGLNDNKECNLLCECFSYDCQIGKNVTNLSGFARCAQRLTKVDVRTERLLHIQNTSNMFLSCWNLSQFSGVGKYIPTIRNCSGMFNDCKNMVSCDFVIPANTNDYLIMNSLFNNCTNLNADIANLIPSSGFSAKKISTDKAFRNCGSLTGKIPVDFLWKDTNIEWVNTGTCFTGSSLAIYAPTSWGGLISDANDNDVSGYTLYFKGEDTIYDETGKQIRIVQDNANPIKFTEFDGKKCLFFNGNGAIVVPNYGDFSEYSSSIGFSVCFWLAKNESTVWEGVVSKRKGNGQADYYFGFKTDTANGIVNRPGVYTKSWKEVNKNLLYNKWYHICYNISLIGGYVAVYINGENIGQLPIGPELPLLNNEPHLLIGAGYAGSTGISDDYYLTAGIGSFHELLHGYLRQVRIYPFFLQDEQVKKIYTATSGMNNLEQKEEKSKKIIDISEDSYSGGVSLNLDFSSQAYIWNLKRIAGTTPNTLTCDTSDNFEHVWNIDIVLSEYSIVQLGSMFDTEASDALTAEKTNYCTVRWNGQNAVLKVNSIGGQL